VLTPPGAGAGWKRFVIVCPERFASNVPGLNSGWNLTVSVVTGVL
jgi:hypothetical protein